MATFTSHKTQFVRGNGHCYNKCKQVGSAREELQEQEQYHISLSLILAIYFPMVLMVFMLSLFVQQL
jgi:hypothetical protein